MTQVRSIARFYCFLIFVYQIKKGAQRHSEHFRGGMTPRSLFWDPIVKKTLTEKVHFFLTPIPNSGGTPTPQFWRQSLIPEALPPPNGGGSSNILFIYTHTRGSLSRTKVRGRCFYFYFVLLFLRSGTMPLDRVEISCNLPLQILKMLELWPNSGLNQYSYNKWTWAQ